MKQCINCSSGEISTVAEKDRIFYYCSNCNHKFDRAIDNTGKIITTKENGLVKHITIGAVIKSYNKILFIDRKKFPFGLCLPTGHLYQNETLEDALRKKVLEKTGYEVKSQKLILHETIGDQCKDGAELHEWYLYECKVGKNESFETYTKNISWIDKNDLPNTNLTDATKIILNKIGLLFNEDIIKRIGKNNTHIPKIKPNNKSKSIKESIIEDLPIAIVIYDLKGKIAFSNIAATKFLERAKNSPSGEAFVKALEGISKRASASKIKVSSNLILDRHQFNIVASPLQNKGVTRGATITIHDITEKKSIEIRDIIAYETSLALCKNQSFRKIIKTILKQLFENMNITSCSLMEKEGDELKVSFQYCNHSRTKQKPLVLKMGQGIAGWVAENRTPLAIPDTKKDPMFYGSGRNKENSLLAVPVISNQQVLGVLNVSKQKNEYFSESEIQAITIVANRIALALENEKLYTQLENEAKTFETVLDTTTNGLVLINKDKTIKFANYGIKKLLNIQNDKIIGQDIFKMSDKISAGEVSKFYTYFEKSIHIKHKLVTEIVLTKPEKTLKTIFNPIIESDGSCNSVLVGTHNITNLKKKEKQIKNQIEQITALFKISSMPNDKEDEFYKRILSKTTELFKAKYSDIIIFGQKKSLSGNIIDINIDASKIIQEIKNKKNGFIINDFRSEFKNNQINKIAVSPIIINKTVIGIIFSVNKKANFKSDDLKLLSIIADRISRKIETDNFIDKISEDKKQIASIIENTGDGIIVFNSKNECIIWNKAIENITGFASFDQYSSHNLEVVNRIKDLKKYSYKTGIETIKKQVKVKNSDDEYIWLSVTYTFLRDANNKEHLIAVIRDVSREIAIDNQQKEFLYTATHELRTPITTIKGYLSMILNGDAGKINKKQSLYFGRVFESTNRLIQLVESLLNVARLEEDKFNFEKNKFDINALAKEVTLDFKKTAQEKNIVLKFNSNDIDPILIIGDQDKTKHAISNLIDNAIKYTKKGRIIISCKSIPDAAIITISDTGVGIPKKAKDQIFNKFYRVPNSESTKAGGTGLGLFITKNLIEKQGGTIQLNSKLGKGSEFIVNLPKNK